MKINEKGYRLAAFGPGDETDCRAVNEIDGDGSYPSYYLTIGGDNGEAISLKVYDSISGQVYDVYIEDEDKMIFNRLIFTADSPEETLDLHIYPPYYYSLAPANLSAHVVNTGQINLNWENHSANGYLNEYRFEIFRCVNADPNRISHYNLIACVDPDVTCYSDPDCSLGNTYYYRVRAFNNQYGYTDYSTWTGATTINKSDLLPSTSSHQSGCFISSVQSVCFTVRMLHLLNRSYKPSSHEIYYYELSSYEIPFHEIPSHEIPFHELSFVENTTAFSW